jgi:hypothetical protein
LCLISKLIDEKNKIVENKISNLNLKEDENEIILKIEEKINLIKIRNEEIENEINSPFKKVENELNERKNRKI